MLQSLTQQIQGGMPVDQAIQYVKSQAAMGVAPLVDLYALLNQFQRMKQPPQQPPVGGTIKQQLDMVEAMNSGLGSPTPMPQDQSQMMAQGLGGMNAGNMEQPQFAGGGIVAFDGGGITAANVKKQMPKNMEEYYAQLGEDEVTLEAVRKERDRQEEIERETQTGRYAPSVEMKRSLLDKQKAELAKDDAERAALDEQAYWGDVAGYAAESGTREKKGPTYLTSLAMAQKAKAERARTSAKEKKDAEKAYDAATLAEAESREALRKGDIDTARKKADEAKALKEFAVKGRIKRIEEEQKDARTQQRELNVAKEQARLSRETADTEPLRKQREKIRSMNRTDTGYDDEVEKLRDMENAAGRNYSSTSTNKELLEINKQLVEAIAAGDEDAVDRLIEYRNTLQAENKTKAPNVARPQLPPGFKPD
jgi:hypothetical protein